MIKYIQGDISDYISPEVVVPHVVNILGIAKSGVVIPIFNKVPEARRRYEILCACQKSNPYYLLGLHQIIEDENGIIANMFAQDLNPPRPLYYNHLVICMESVANYCLRKNKGIVAPEFGCGLAMGNKDFIFELILDCWIKRNIHVTLIKFDG